MDAFFIGDGSARLLEGYVEEETYSRQICIPEEFVEVEDDISSQSHDVTELTTRDEVDFVFYTYKKQVYDLFDFLELKSAQLRGIPVKLEDLVLDDADKYLIDYLMATVKDLSTWKSLAQLHACMNMQVPYVQFLSDHNCPLCRASTGTIFRVESLIRSLCTGGQITHSGCVCELFPVLYRESYEGPLDNQMDIEVLTLADRDFLHVPKELYKSGRLDKFVDVRWPEVDFVNMPKWCSDNKIKDSQGVVVYVEEETMYVHNSYVANRGPVDFLASYLASVPALEQLDDLTGKDTYLLNGQLVVKHGDHFYDAQTGKRK